MSIKIVHDGIEFTVTTAAEAAALARELKSGHSRSTSPINVSPATNQESIEQAEVAHSFLTAIRNAGTEGADAEHIGKVLHTPHLRGIGGRTAPINKLLVDLGYDPRAVYSNTRTGRGRFWKPGKKLDEAMEAVRRKIPV